MKPAQPRRGINKHVTGVLAVIVAAEIFSGSRVQRWVSFAYPQN